MDAEHPLEWLGGDLMSDLVGVLMEEVPDEEARKRIYRVVRKTLHAAGWTHDGDATAIDYAYDAMLAEEGGNEPIPRDEWP